jgi:hypothetical protein
MNNAYVENTRGNKRSPKISSALFALLLALGGGVALTGCEEQGPAEKAGEKIDDAVEDAGDKIDEAGDSVEEAADEVEEETDGS